MTGKNKKRMESAVRMARGPQSSHMSSGRAVLHRFMKNKGAAAGLIIIAVLVLVAVTCPLWIDYETQVIGVNVAERLQGPSLAHWCGTDASGRDLFFRIIWGSRISLLIGTVSCCIAVCVGVPVGAVSGYYGGKLDLVIMRVVDIFSAVPSILMGVVIVSMLGRGSVNLMLAVGITSIPSFAVITRAAVMTVKNQEYVEASRALGKSDAYIIFRHVLPNCLSPIVVQISICIASAIISASSLSFLGLGVAIPSPEWGALLSDGHGFIRKQAYLTAFPGLAIMLVVISFNMIGDALRDAMDPKLKR